MGMFVEVHSIEKDCNVIINLEHIVEVAPLREGGCAVFFNDGAAVSGVRSMKVKNNYSEFQQLVMTLVTKEAMDTKISKLKKVVSEMEIPKLG